MHSFHIMLFICRFLCLIFTLCCLYVGLVETDPEAALEGFAEVVRMEPEKAEW